MVTKKSQLRRIYLKEHREAKGMSAAEMGEKLGMERESVYRLEKKYWGVSAQKQAAYAAALDIDPEALWRPPGSTPSLDSIVKSAPDDLKAMAADIVRRLVEQR